MFLSQFWKDLRAQKLRSALTILGIVWGTVSIVLLLGFGTGLGDQMSKTFHGLGNGIVIVFPGITSRPFEGFNRGRSITLHEEDAELIRRQTKRLAAISLEYEKEGVPLARGDNRVSIKVSGVLPEFGDMRNLIPEPGGRFLDALDVRYRRRVVFLGDKVKTDLFGDAPAVGEQVLLSGTPFTVIGVMKHKAQDSDYSGRDSEKIHIPATTFATLFSATAVQYLIFQARTPELNPEAIKDLYRILGRRHRFDPTDREALKVWDTTELDRFFGLFVGGFNVFVGVVGAFTLVVGAIGVSNIMNAVVEERTREIGIKMALGAKKRFIRSQILLETLLVTGTGGLLGFLISWVIVVSVSRLDLGDYIGAPTISPLVALITVSLLGVVGALAGYGPARRASDVNPVVALKK
ncbi:MAG: ABC transporter permease [Vicinamibacteria bacterium]